MYGRIRHIATLLILSVLVMLVFDTSLTYSVDYEKLNVRIEVEKPLILLPNHNYVLTVRVVRETDKPLYEGSVSIRILVDQPFEVYNWNRRDHGIPPQYYVWLYYYHVGNMTGDCRVKEVTVYLKVLPHAYSGSHIILVAFGAYTNKSLTWSSWRYSRWYTIDLLVVNPVDSVIVLSFTGILYMLVLILASPRKVKT
ncbi:TPA: hypothetical protein EYP83_00255 [Candidatus Geothermarchaeota archaeon]|nr:hypothetical protein [Candidatus Geothermarchaeota archaeon]